MTIFSRVQISNYFCVKLYVQVLYFLGVIVKLNEMKCYTKKHNTIFLKIARCNILKR